MNRLSVIIPAYNSAATLVRCVDSVLSQSVDGIDMLLVDDGSTDGTAALCDKLAQQHSEIRVIHKMNGGLSSARNDGLDVAQGEYIAFIDSDDEYGKDSLGANLAWMEEHPEVDLLEFPVAVHFGSQRRANLFFEPRTVTENIFSDWVESEGYTHCYAWNKIYRRSLFDGLRFPDGEAFEDAAICPAIIKRCSQIHYSSWGLYLYYDTPDGISHDYSFKVQEPLLRHNLNLTEQVFKDRCCTKPAYVRLWNCCLNRLIDLGRCSDADKGYMDDASARLRKCRPSLLRVSISGIPVSQKIKSALTVLLGVSKASKILGISKFQGK